MRRRIHGCTEDGHQLSSLIALDDTMTVWMNEGWATDVIYCHFSRAFDTSLSCVLVYELSYHSLDESPSGCLEQEQLSCSMRLRAWGWFSQGMRRFWGSQSRSSSWYTPGDPEDKSKLIKEAHGGWMRDNRHKWELEGFRLD